MISVGISDGNEIFARGTIAVLADDPDIEVATISQDELEGQDVGVVSTAVALATDSSTPLVVCADGTGHALSMVKTANEKNHPCIRLLRFA